MSSEDEAVASDLDMHALILGGLSDAEPVKTAEEVIREIDVIMEVILTILPSSTSGWFTNTIPPLQTGPRSLSLS